MAPYSGVPKGSEAERRIESCVKQVMAKNPSWSKSRAIATCRSTIEKKKEVAMRSKPHNLKTSPRQRRKTRKEVEEQAPDAAEEIIEEELEEMGLEDDIPLSEVEEEEIAEEFVEEVEIQEEEPQEELELVHDDEDFDFDIPEEVEELSMEELVEELIEIEEEEPEEKPEEEKSFDYDVAQAEMLLSMDGNNIAESVKAVLSYPARKNLPDSAFALIVNRDGKKMRKYPIHDKAHIRNALSRAAQQIKSGGEGAADARKAFPKIRAAAKKMGIGQPSKKNACAIIVEKDRNDDFRWVGWASGKYLDRDGEIIEEAAHKEFVEYCDETPEWIIDFRSWHTAGTNRTNPVDAVIYKNGFLIMSGKLEEAEAQSLLRASSKQKLGLSIGMFNLRDPYNPRVICKYRAFEVSDLPSDKAAFPLSDFTVMLKENLSMNKKADYLKEMLGEDRYQKLLEDTEMKESIAESLGIPSKELDQPIEDEAISGGEETKEEKPVIDEEMTTLLKSVLGLDKVDFSVLEKMAVVADVFPAFAQRLDDVQNQLKERDSELEKREEELKESQKDSDERLADFVNNSIFNKSAVKKARASEREDTEVDEKELDEKFKKPEHKNFWLAEEFGVEPVAPPTEN